MNGGKDFSAWSKQDDLLYQTLRVPVEAVLGRDGVGLADCAIAESKFEKGEDISGRMLTMLPRISEIHATRARRTWSLPSPVFWRAASCAAGQSGRRLAHRGNPCRTQFAEEGQERLPAQHGRHALSASTCTPGRPGLGGRLVPGKGAQRSRCGSGRDEAATSI